MVARNPRTYACLIRDGAFALTGLFVLTVLAPFNAADVAAHREMTLGIIGALAFGVTALVLRAHCRCNDRSSRDAAVDLLRAEVGAELASS